MVYTTQTGKPTAIKKSMFTLITEKAVFRIKALSETQIRTALSGSSLKILAIERDAD